MLSAAKEDTALLSDAEAEERFHLLVAERDSLVVY
jgi:hypothetical protein